MVGVIGLQDQFLDTQLAVAASLSPVTGRVFPPTWRGRYPHLMPLDRVIWSRFLVIYGLKYLGFQYDILLGRGAPAPANFSKEDRELLFLATVKRADCLGITDHSIDLVEVKPRLGMACIGQLVAYRELWFRQYGRQWPLRLVAVVEQSEDDLLYVAERVGLFVVVV